MAVAVAVAVAVGVVTYCATHYCISPEDATPHTNPEKKTMRRCRIMTMLLLLLLLLLILIDSAFESYPVIHTMVATNRPGDICG